MIDEENERGSLSLEFIMFGAVVLVPFVYFILALTSVQQNMLAADSAARHVARSIALSTTAEQADERAAAVLDTIWEQYSLAPEEVGVTVHCTPSDVPCPSAGAIVHVEVALRAPLPFVSDVPGLERLASIPVHAAAVNRMGKAWAE